MVLTFGMRTPGDCLADFRAKIRYFVGDDLNESLAMDCAIAAWSTVDWIFESDGARLGYQNTYDLGADLRAACPSLAYLQSIANARKHMKLRRVSLVKSAGKHNGEFSSEFSRDFNVSRLVIRTETEELDFLNTLRKALDFLEEFFDAHQIH